MPDVSFVVASGWREASAAAAVTATALREAGACVEVRFVHDRPPPVSDAWAGRFLPARGSWWLKTGCVAFFVPPDRDDVINCGLRGIKTVAVVLGDEYDAVDVGAAARADALIAPTAATAAAAALWSLKPEVLRWAAPPPAAPDGGGYVYFPLFGDVLLDGDIRAAVGVVEAALADGRPCRVAVSRRRLTRTRRRELAALGRRHGGLLAVTDPPTVEGLAAAVARAAAVVWPCRCSPFGLVARFAEAAGTPLIAWAAPAQEEAAAGPLVQAKAYRRSAFGLAVAADPTATFAAAAIRALRQPVAPATIRPATGTPPSLFALRWAGLIAK
jgi:hypothetical protein